MMKLLIIKILIDKTKYCKETPSVSEFFYADNI
jgi:hypothetical protein